MNMGTFDKKFDSAKQDWNTPDDLFEGINLLFDFEWDLAASAENTKCKKFFTAEQDALKQLWEGVCWLNPPYGDKSSKIVDWVRKAYCDSQANPNLTVVMLIPARTNTRWFHQYCMKAAELYFLCGRPKFGGAVHGLPQPLMLVVFKKSSETKFSSFYT